MQPRLVKVGKPIPFRGLRQTIHGTPFSVFLDRGVVRSDVFLLPGFLTSFGIEREYGFFKNTMLFSGVFLTFLKSSFGLCLDTATISMANSRSVNRKNR